MAFGKPKTPLTPEEQLQRRQNLGLGLAALSETFKGGDPVARTLGLQQQFEQQETQKLAEQEMLAEQQEMLAEQQKLQQFAQTNPEFAKMFELFGKQGLQKAYLQDIERQQQTIQSQQQVQDLKNAGFSEQEINMVLAGLNPKDVIEFRASASSPSGSQIIENVEKNVEKTIKETEVLNTFANLDQAFGPIDAAQETASIATRKLFGFDVDPLGSGTGAAVRSKNSLNTEILANLAADFTGKPNMLIYKNIEGNLPMGSATSEKDAKEKYINIKNQVDARVNNLKQGIESTIISNENKEKYRDELNKSLLLSKKLDAAILSLTGEKKETLRPPKFGSEGKYSELYTRDY